MSNIANEKNYLLEVVHDGQLNYIPAVKRGDKYLNLISMDEFNLDDEKSLKKQSTCYLSFIAKHGANF